jgi:adenylate cyclase
LLVIARNSSFQYRDKSLDMKRVGRELGVEYLVEGSVRKADNRLRITAQLIEASTGSHLWAERYDRDLKDVFEIQDEVTRTIVATLALRVTRRGAEKARRKPTRHWAAYDYFLKGQEHLNRYETEKAMSLLLHAVELDPDYAQACALLADCYLSIYFVDAKKETLDTAFTYAQKALSIDDDDGMSHYAMGFVQMYYHQFDLAEMHLLRAVDLNPNSVYFAIFYSYWLAMVGRPKEALENLDVAARRDPLRFAGFYQVRTYALFVAKRYQEAIHTFNQIEPKQYWDYAYVAASYANLDRQPEAHAAAAELLRLLPRFSISWFDKILCFRKTDDLEHLHVGMRKAGLPD